MEKMDYLDVMIIDHLVESGIDRTVATIYITNKDK